MQPPTDILIVDDETDIIDLITELLQDEGYAVRAALNAEAALNAVAQRRPAMILLDMFMPHMTGITLWETLQRQGNADIPVVMMTASIHTTQKMLFDGVVECLPKPFDLDQLLACVARYAPRLQDPTV